MEFLRFRETWRLIPLPDASRKFSLHSICFLTDRVGWIAGGSVVPYSQTHVGIVLFTDDGGHSWSVLGEGRLPYLRSIQFFDLERGIAAGEHSPTYPAGLLTTEDGGKTWQAGNADHVGAWNQAAFFSPGEGIVVGEQGNHGILANGHLNPGTSATHGLHALHDVTADVDGRCWIVGDGGFVRTSTNRGVSWSVSTGSLPRELDGVMDFRGVTRNGPHVWIAGSPGAVVWHSADGGATWEPQATGGATPLYAIQFADGAHGIAAGALGRICVTHDGGRTWRDVRGSNRRLAGIVIHAHQHRLSVPFVTRWAKEDGYRIGVSVVARRDLGVDAHAADSDRVQLAQTVLLSGGNVGETDWRLPLAIPGLARDSEKLLEEWSLLTDRRLAEVFIGHLVAQLRTWRPDVVLLDEAPADDFATQFTSKAVMRAIEQAAEPHHYENHLRLAELSPWQVKKIVVQRPLDRDGSIRQDPFQVLPHLKTTLDLAAAEGATCLGTADRLHQLRSYVVKFSTSTDASSARTIFGDLKLAPGSAARRALPMLKSVDYEKLIEQSQKRRELTSLTRSAVRGPGHGAHLLGQIKPMLKPLTREYAARQLAELARMYRAESQWTLAEATYAELVTSYADQPAALEAMRWLIPFWTSEEMNWQRLRTIQGSNSQLQIDPNLVQANFERAASILRDGGTRISQEEKLRNLPDSVDESAAPLTLTSGNLSSVVNGSGVGAEQRQMRLTRWLATADALAMQLQARHPRLFEEPSTQFVVAALMRRRARHQQADEIYNRFLQSLDDDPWAIAARGEAWLLRRGVISPKPVVRCMLAAIPPVLDGQLSDPCWTGTNEIRLGDDDESSTFVGADQSGGSVMFTGRKPIVMFCYDTEYLYLAARIPIEEALADDHPLHGGRTHDADLGRYDHVKVQFDVDRDYNTFYQFEVDQRGWTRETCWEARSYNPQWFVAADREETSWSLEAAIPMEQLVPPGEMVGATWAVGVTRVLPGIGAQSWTNAGAEVPQPARFGLLQFSGN